MKLSAWLGDKLVKLGKDKQHLGFNLRENPVCIHGLVVEYDVESGTIVIEGVNVKEQFVFLSVEDVVGIYTYIEGVSAIDVSNPKVN